MSREISLFPSYDQKENRTTNYCLLILRLLYEENPKYLAEVLNDASLGLGDCVGVKFLQQQKKAQGIPDGEICQRSFAIVIESKHHGMFDSSQLERHVDSLATRREELRVLAALGTGDRSDSQFDRVRRLAGKYGVEFLSLSFDKFASALGRPHLPKNLIDTIAEFRAYLDAEGLLDSWQNRLDVVNCTKDYDNVLKLSIYRCGSTKGAYSHRRCKYFGLYQNKKVAKIATIRGLVDFPDACDPKLQWNNTGEDDQILVQAAKASYDKYPSRIPSARVFLLGEFHSTSFAKDTHGGMQTSKQYFDVSRLKATDDGDLAAKLTDMKWSDFKIIGKHE